MSDAAKNARKSLEDLKKQLQTAQPVVVDKTGRLSTPRRNGSAGKSYWS